MFRKNEDRAIVVGETGSTSSDSGGFWKGVAVGAGGLMILGVGVSLINSSMTSEYQRQNAEYERVGRESRERRERKLNRDQLLAGREHA